MRTIESTAQTPRVLSIFVTGASGFLGGAALRKLLRAGHRVRAMSRSARTDALISALGATPVRCDLESVRAEHLAGCDAVLHCAACVEEWGPRDAWYRGNVLGTLAMLDAARGASVARFIHIGSEAALARGQPIDGADETWPLAPDSPYPYCATKAQAELLVRAANAPGFTTLVLRPRFIWGEGDTKVLPLLLGMVESGKWAWIDHGNARSSTTHVFNLVHAIELALTHGCGGEAYFILDDGVRTLREVISRMAATAGVTLPGTSIPTWLADAVASTCERVWRLFRLRGTPPLTRYAAMEMSRTCVLSDDKARRELGYRPVIDFEAGIAGLRASISRRV